MDTKLKELVAVAASVAAGCEYCTSYHVKAAREAGATQAELERMVELSLCVREKATARMKMVARNELGLSGDSSDCGCCAPPTALEALASAASALASNCGSGVAPFLAQASRLGVEERDCQFVLALARKIKKVAAEKADEEATGKACHGGDCCSKVSQSPCCDS